MAYAAPTFNLLCDIYDYTTTPVLVAPRLAGVPCNLALGRRVYDGIAAGTAGVVTKLLVPVGTDIRDLFCFSASGGDIVQCPPGSGRIYTCGYVEDAGKGFANEHRVAFLYKTSYYGLWPIPIP